jgi:hypothetical protein
MAKETNGSPNENIRQSTQIGTTNEAQEESNERNVDALLRTLKVIINVFRTFNWVTKERWP